MPAPLHLGATRADPQSPELPPEQARGSLPGNKEAWARPLPLGCHDIVPRVTPFLCNHVREHGKTCFSWFGPVPNVTVTDPALVKDLLSNKFGHFEKPQFPALTKLISDGLTSHEGQKWVKHRRILNPAFHLEKLKVYHQVSVLQLLVVTFQRLGL